MERRAERAAVDSSVGSAGFGASLSSSDSLTFDQLISESLTGNDGAKSRLFLRDEEEEDSGRYVVSPDETLLLRRGDSDDEDDEKEIKRDDPDCSGPRTREMPEFAPPTVIDRSRINSSKDCLKAIKGICVGPPLALPGLAPLEERDVTTAEQCTLLTALQEVGISTKDSEEMIVARPMMMRRRLKETAPSVMKQGQVRRLNLHLQL